MKKPKLPNKVYKDIRLALVKFYYESNNDDTWNRIEKAVKSVLKSHRVVKDSYVFCNRNTNTPETIEREECHIGLAYTLDGLKWIGEALVMQRSKVDVKNLKKFIADDTLKVISELED